MDRTENSKYKSRKDLTVEWNRSEIEFSQEYAILTDEITKAWSGKMTQEYKNYKGLRKENLMDNMTILN